MTADGPPGTRNAGAVIRRQSVDRLASVQMEQSSDYLPPPTVLTSEVCTRIQSTGLRREEELPDHCLTVSIRTHTAHGGKYTDMVVEVSGAGNQNGHLLLTNGGLLVRVSAVPTPGSAHSAPL